MGSTLTVDLFLSVDGWAGSNGLPGYFGYPGPDLESWIASETASRHLQVLGRRTYELLAGMPDGAREEGGNHPDRTQTLVFSRTLRQADWPNTRICGRDVVDEIRRLKVEGDAPMRTVGSLSLIRQLLCANLVDRMRLMTFPLLAGTFGREAAFAGVASADLELVDHRALDGRVLLLEYRPTGRDIPRA